MAIQTVPVLMHAKHNMSDIEGMIKVVTIFHVCDACVYMPHALVCACILKKLLDL